MHWWIATVASVCGALLIQYFCSSRILRMKQAISMKNMALREAKASGQRLDDQEAELESQQRGLKLSLDRLRPDIKALLPRLKEQGVDIPEPDFPASDVEDDPDISGSLG